MVNITHNEAEKASGVVSLGYSTVARTNDSQYWLLYRIPAAVSFSPIYLYFLHRNSKHD